MENDNAPDPQSNPAAEESELMKLAESADNGTLKPEDLGKPAGKPDAAPQDEHAKPGEQGKDAKPGEKPADKPADDKTKADPKPGEKPEAKPGEKPTFEQAKKDAERRDKSWKALDAEKAEFRQKETGYQQQIQKLTNELAAARRKPSGPIKDANGASAADYDTLAKKYEESGESDLLAMAKQKAAELRTKEQQAANQPDSGAFESPEFQETWNRNVQELIKADPTLAEKDNPISAAANTLWRSEDYGRFFKAHPDGIKAAVEVAKMMREAGKVKPLQEKLTTTEDALKTSQAEVERLNGLLQPRGSHPSGPPAGQKKVEDMSDDEADAHIRREAEKADRG